MKVFISWSGQESQEVGRAVDEWLGQVFQTVDTFISTRGIGAGDRSMTQIEEGLRDVDFGIICVTPENQNAPWLSFEAGAISNAVGGESKVAPLLAGFRSKADLDGPLAQFQTSLTDREGFDAIAASINAVLGEQARREDQLKLSMDMYWNRLEAQIKQARTSAQTGAEKPTAERDTHEMIEEILTTVRAIHRSEDTRRQSMEHARYGKADVPVSSEIRATVRTILAEEIPMMPGRTLSIARTSEGVYLITVRLETPIPEDTQHIIRHRISEAVESPTRVRFVGLRRPDTGNPSKLASPDV
ncbi:hypothetical protein C1H84_16245 [Glutamicibacter soli]|uniref:TIR domain-containing protein n=1 Tax=Glutamicibacter soli TaxID=453836 RepID=A0A365Y970_9MICC|nr:toll/interleukin-1 receptor domain-containing protein [Glutamicibacter soli]RBL99234.1 hypothetical protein C1H84_16245 [Glutamicibacter soli]